MRAQPTLFDASRLTLEDAIDLTAQSLRAHGAGHDHWCLAWSGGKDSTATLTLVCHLITTGAVPAPRSLRVLYADTRQELPPLAIAAQQIMAVLTRRGICHQVVQAPIDKRFLVYILGRGVPPPNNNTLRWCTRQIKVDPMTAAIAAALDTVGGEILTLTGVRQGESAARDARIALSCGRNGAECGQGWYQEVLPGAAGIRGRIATLAPLLHWRVCHVWDWLRFHAPAQGWPTAEIADAYGGDDAEELAARTGCIGCPLASREVALETVIASPRWSYLAPLAGLKPLYRELRRPEHRLRKPGLERRKDGTPAANPQRLGPLTFAARLMGLNRVLDIQDHCNAEAARLGRPRIDILNGDEEARIRALIMARTWPDGWAGDEPTGDVPLDTVFADGWVQPLLVQ